MMVNLILAAAFFVACAGSGDYGKAVSAELSDDGAIQKITITIDRGYYPNNVQARPGIPLKVTFLRDEAKPSCAGEIQIPAIGYQQVVEEDGQVSVTIPPQAEGEIPFHCSMHHMKGRIVYSASAF